MKRHDRQRENPLLGKAISLECAFPLPPSTGRLVRVAAGLEQWTPEELAWIKENPSWVRYEQRLRDAFEEEQEVELAGTAFSWIGANI